MKKEDIIARLKNGEDMDNIASELTAMLNAAQADYEAELLEKAKEELAKAEAEAEAKAKLEDANEIVEMLEDFVATYYPDKTNVLEMTGEELIAAFETVFSMSDILNQLGKMYGVAIPAKTKAKSAHPIDNVVKDDVSNIINDFLKSIGC